MGSLNSPAQPWLWDPTASATRPSDHLACPFNLQPLVFLWLFFPSVWHPLNPPRSSCCPAAVSTTWFLMSDGFPMWAGFYWWLKHSIISLHPEHLALVLWGWTLSKGGDALPVSSQLLSDPSISLHFLSPSVWEYTWMTADTANSTLCESSLFHSTCPDLRTPLMDFQTSANCFALVFACFLEKQRASNSLYGRDRP